MGGLKMQGPLYLSALIDTVYIFKSQTYSDHGVRVDKVSKHI